MNKSDLWKGAVGSETLAALLDRTTSLMNHLNRVVFGPTMDQFDAKLAESMPLDRRIPYLIGHLDESRALVAVPGGAWFTAFGPAGALVEIGEAAIPALKDTIANDKRLTRVTYARFDGMLLYIYSVADVAKQILRKIEEGQLR